MRVKCRGCEGKLIYLDATETAEIHTVDGIKCVIAWYDISIRSDDGAKIVLTRVNPEEVEVING